MFCSDEDVDVLFLFVLFCFFLDTFLSTVSLCIVFRFSVETIRVKFGRSEISVIPDILLDIVLNDCVLQSPL